MKFTTAFVLAVAVVGVSANVHSSCECVSDGEMNQTLTATACKSVRSLYLILKLHHRATRMLTC